MAVVPCGRPSEPRSRAGGPNPAEQMDPGFLWVGPSYTGKGRGDQQPQQWAGTNLPPMPGDVRADGTQGFWAGKTEAKADPSFDS